MNDGEKYKIFKSKDGYGNIRIAIVNQAIIDYKKALRTDNETKITALERWFKSEWGEMLSGYNGAYIIEKVKKEVYNNA